MDKALRRFALYLKRHFGQSSTAKHYLSDLTIFVDIIGKKALKDVTPVDIDAFIDHQLAAGLKPATINRRLSSLHTLFEFLASENPTRPWPNPVIWRRHRLKTGTHLPRDARDSEVTRLFAVMEDVRDQVIYGLMVGAGLRVGEITALTLDDLDPCPEPGHLAKLRVRGKGSKERTVWGMCSEGWNRVGLMV
jgi:site-specific recombinase XerD